MQYTAFNLVREGDNSEFSVAALNLTLRFKKLVFYKLINNRQPQLRQDFTSKCYYILYTKYHGAMFDTKESFRNKFWFGANDLGR